MKRSLLLLALGLLCTLLVLAACTSPPEEPPPGEPCTPRTELSFRIETLPMPSPEDIAIGDFDGVVGGVEILLNPDGSSAHYVLDITGYYF